MSEAATQREWRFYVDDMVGFAEKVTKFSEGLDQAAFVADEMRFDATVRNLELIGEAATRIPESIRQSAQNVPWRLIVAVRNRLIHGYLGIDNDTLWSIIKTDVPALILQLRELQGETAYLLNSPANASKLVKSLDEADNGKLLTKSLPELRKLADE